MKFIQVDIDLFFESLTYQEILVYSYLKYYTNQNIYQLSVKSISNTLNIDRRNLIRCINNLKNKGFIKYQVINNLSYIRIINIKIKEDPIIKELKEKWRKN